MTGAGVTPAPFGWSGAWRIALAVYVSSGLLSLVWQPALLRVAPGVLVMSAIGAFVTVSLADGSAQQSLAGQFTRTVRLAGLYAALLVATVSHLAVLGPLTLLLAGGLAVTSPWTLRRVGATRPGSGLEPVEREPGRVEPDVLPEAAAHADLGFLSTRELAGAWGRTYWLLERAGTCQARMLIVAERQQLLDELERRDGIALRRWLESGPRAAANPAKFFPDGEPPEAIAS